MSSATKHNVLRLLQPMTTGHSRESWIENIEEGNHTVWKCQPPLPHFLCRCWHLERETRRQIPHITNLPRRREMWLHGSFEMSTEPCWNFSWRYNVNNAWFSSYNSLHCVGLSVFPVLHRYAFCSCDHWVPCMSRVWYISCIFWSLLMYCYADSSYSQSW